MAKKYILTEVEDDSCPAWVTAIAAFVILVGFVLFIIASIINAITGAIQRAKQEKIDHYTSKPAAEVHYLALEECPSLKPTDDDSSECLIIRDVLAKKIQKMNATQKEEYQKQRITNFELRLDKWIPATQKKELKEALKIAE